MTHYSQGRFPHSRLDAWHVALELAEGSVHLTDPCPRGFADLRDQLRRDATLETAARLGLFPAEEIQRVRVLADRVSAMLTGLVKREERRMPPQRRLTEPGP